MNTSIMQTLGAEAKDYAQTLKAANLDWEPLHDTVSGTDTAIQMPRMKLLYRSDNKAPLGIVGEGYCPSQPRAFLQSQYEFAEFVKGSVTRAGFLEDRARAFCFTKLDDIKVKAKEDRKVGDICGVYIYSTDGWDGGTPQKSRLFVERLRCKNGMRSKELKSALWVPHTSGREALYEKRWKIFLNEVATVVTEIRTQFNTLAEMPMSKEQMLDFAMRLLPGDAGKVVGTRERIVNLFSEGEGNRGTSRWDAYNAVTEYTTHGRTSRVQEGSGRAVESNRFLSVLEKDKLSPRALELLLQN